MSKYADESNGDYEPRRRTSQADRLMNNIAFSALKLVFQDDMNEARGFVDVWSGVVASRFRIMIGLALSSIKFLHWTTKYFIDRFAF